MGCCEHVNEPEDSIKGGEFLDLLNDYQLLKDSATQRCYVIVPNLKYSVVMSAGKGVGKPDICPILGFFKKEKEMRI
jgi:hypothetical protein